MNLPVEELLGVAIDVPSEAKMPLAPIQEEFPFEKPFPPNSFLGRVKTIATAVPTIRMLDSSAARNYTELDIDVIVLDIKEDWTCLEPIQWFISKEPANDSYDNKRLRTREVYAALKRTLERGKPSNAMMRLILVEDLSLAMVEVLGSTLDLESKFFADHIDLESDYRIQVFPSKVSIDFESQSKSVSFGKKPEQFFSMRWKRALRDQPSTSKATKIPPRNFPKKMQLQLVKSMHRTDINPWLVEWLKEDVDVIAVEERLTYMEREDDRGSTGVLLFLSPRDMGDSESGHGSRDLDVDLLSRRTIYSPADPECVGRFGQLFGPVIPAYTSARSQFLNYVAELKSKSSGAISMSENSCPSMILSHLVLPSYQDILSEMHSFLDTVDEQLSDDQALETHIISWRSSLGRYRINLIKYRDMIKEILAVCDGRKLQETEHCHSLQQDVKDLMERTEKTYSILMSSMAVVESQRAIRQAEVGIQQAESITRLTELAFFFIPLSFTTSVFGMQIPGWSENYTPYMLGAMTASILCGAYGLRLLVHILILRKSKERFARSVRNANDL